MDDATSDDRSIIAWCLARTLQDDDIAWFTLALASLGIATSLDGVHDGGVRAGPTNAKLFKLLDERPLGIARWWAGKDLPRLGLCKLKGGVLAD